MRGLFIIALLLLVLFLFSAFPYAVDSETARMRLLYLVLLLSFIALGAGSLRRAPVSTTTRNVAIWVLIFAALVLGYSFKNDIGGSRLLANLMPSKVQTDSGGRMSVQASDGGHFLIDARVNDAPVRFMVDTGASDIMLTPNDARRAGFDTQALAYTRNYSTANGFVGGAPVTIRALQVGEMLMQDVPASVNAADMEQSLLGMSFLRQFSSFEVKKDTLILNP